MKLKNKVVLYIPSTFNVNISCDNKTQVEKACVFFSSLFGGCTTINAIGNWIDSNNNLITENITLVYSNCTTMQLLKSKKAIINYARNLCNEMKQECISLEINNRLMFID